MHKNSRTKDLTKEEKKKRRYSRLNLLRLIKWERMLIKFHINSTATYKYFRTTSLMYVHLLLYLKDLRQVILFNIVYYITVKRFVRNNFVIIR